MVVLWDDVSMGEKDAHWTETLTSVIRINPLLNTTRSLSSSDSSNILKALEENQTFQIPKKMNIYSQNSWDNSYNALTFLNSVYETVHIGRKN